MVIQTAKGGLIMSRSKWNFIINAVIDDIRGTLLLLAIILACLAIGIGAFGIAKPQESGAKEFALFMAALAAICAALRAGLTRWRRARDRKS